MGLGHHWTGSFGWGNPSVGMCLLVLGPYLLAESTSSNVSSSNGDSGPVRVEGVSEMCSNSL